MIRQCAWCLKLMGETPPLKDTSMTHGICEECERKMMRKIESMEDMRKAS